MINPLAWLKHQLSHPKESSLHFRATEFVWKKKAYGKTCSFYWYKLPLALVALSIVCVLVVALTVIGAFFGFAATLFDPKDQRLEWDHDNRMWYPYKTLPSGRRIPVAPWEIAAIGTVCLGLYYLTFIDQATGLIVLTWTSAGLGTLVVFVAICVTLVYSILKGWKHPLLAKARANVGAAWDRVCPELEVEPD